jgi:hypothetical protein
MHGGQRFDLGHHALVARAAGQADQPLVIAVDELGARFLGPLDELPHAGVAPGGVDMHLDDGGGCGLQPHGDGMEAEQDLGAQWVPSCCALRNSCGRPGGLMQHCRRWAQRQACSAVSAPISKGWCSM